jgi:hypothetical protein
VGIERPNNDSNEYGNEVIIITAQGSLEVIMY